MLIDVEEGKQPILTKEYLADSSRFKEFRKKFKPKTVVADYNVYSTEADIFPDTPTETFISLIESKDAKLICNSELIMDKSETKNKKKKNKPVLKKKRKTKAKTINLITYGLVAVCVIGFVGMGTYSLGMKNGAKSVASPEKETSAANVTVDGMIIPIQEEYDDSSEQITLSIDRSYSAIPTEDLQIKGSVVNGKAQITLPEFDRNDFFTHVEGYTWGFSSDPDSKKIEYYGGHTYDFTEDMKLYRVLVKYGGGSGTKNDPYLIDYYDQLELMAEEQARGYFKQVDDIEYPDWASHKPIDTVNELKADPDNEYFEYDGNGYFIKKLDAPLFGKVSGAAIKNVNITDSVIESTEFKDYGFVVSNVYNYEYETVIENESEEENKEKDESKEKSKDEKKDEDQEVAADNDNIETIKYVTGETLIQNCSVSHCSFVLEHPKTNEPTTEVIKSPEVVPPDVAEHDKDGKLKDPTKKKSEEPKKTAEYSVGAITGNGGQIENCYVTDFSVSANLSDYFLYVGGISGKPANVIDSAVYSFSAKGKIFNVGGIAGSGCGSRMYNATGEQLPICYGGNFKGCVVRKVTIHSELSGGGIIGEGSTNSTSAMIANCYSKGLTMKVGEYKDSERTEIIKEGIEGGIIGADGNELNGHSIMNCVSPVTYSPIGKAEKSSYDDSIRIAPPYAFYQENILTVINKNSVDPKNPKEIFTGTFEFNENDLFGDEEGSLPYPEEIKELIKKVKSQEENKNG